MNERTIISIFIRLPNGNGTELQISPSISLNGLVNLLKMTQLDLPEEFRLVLRGQRLKDYSKKLVEVGLSNNSILHLQPSSKVKYSNSLIDVAFLLRRDKFVVKTSPDETVAAFKVSIFNLTNINPKDQILVFLGKKLKNQQTLKHYKVTPDSLLSLKVQSSEPSQDQHLNHIDLINSVCSLNQKKSSISNTTLFRSDSINRRKCEIPGYQIEIHKKRQKNQSDIVNRIDLFNSYRSSNCLKKSVTFDNLFDNARLVNETELQEQEINLLQTVQIVEGFKTQ